MHCHLLVADLFWPDPDERDIYRELDTPALDQLLAKGRPRREDAATVDAWLCARFELDRQPDSPVAAYSLIADGGVPAGDHWLRADPVHLKAERERVVLADSGTFAISQQEADFLTDALNAHFASDGLCFYPLRPDRWYLRAASEPALETTPLSLAAGRSIDRLLPRGAHSLAWRGKLNEMQMLLHAHPVNATRESAGRVPINSVWLWGGGRARDIASAPFDSVWGQDAFAAGLAKAARASAAGLPADAAGLLAAAVREGVSLILLEQLRSAAQYGDAHGWRESLLRLERDWFAPLLLALRQERIGMLTVHALGPAGTLSVETARGDLNRFWRRAKPLAQRS